MEGQGERGLLLPPLLPALTPGGSPAVATQRQAWTFVVFMDQTLGEHFRQLALGVAFFSCLAAP